jgi:hypothetical protein
MVALYIGCPKNDIRVAVGKVGARRGHDRGEAVGRVLGEGWSAGRNSPQSFGEYTSRRSCPARLLAPDSRA